MIQFKDLKSVILHLYTTNGLLKSSPFVNFVVKKVSNKPKTYRTKVFE